MELIELVLAFHHPSAEIDLQWDLGALLPAVVPTTPTATRPWSSECAVPAYRDTRTAGQEATARCFTMAGAAEIQTTSKQGWRAEPLVWSGQSATTNSAAMDRAPGTVGYGRRVP